MHVVSSSAKNMLASRMYGGEKKKTSTNNNKKLESENLGSLCGWHFSVDLTSENFGFFLA